LDLRSADFMFGPIVSTNSQADAGYRTYSTDTQVAPLVSNYDREIATERDVANSIAR
jgi:hypothetical protein